MKKFDWKFFEKQASPARFKWLKNNWNRLITEQQFVEAMILLKETRRGRSKCYQPSRIKQQYKMLKNKFGFFDEPNQ